MIVLCETEDYLLRKIFFCKSFFFYQEKRFIFFVGNRMFFLRGNLFLSLGEFFFLYL